MGNVEKRQKNGMDTDTLTIPWHKTERGRAYARNYYLQNRVVTIERAKQWVKNNPSKRREILLRFADRNRAKERERARRRHRENPQRSLDRLKKWQRKARLERPQFVVKTRLRCRLRAAFQRGYGKKIGSTIELIGCSWDELKRHIESKFTDGMSWKRIKEIDIDHIQPCASFDLTNPEQQRACFHYFNLQPLWKSDNRRKGARAYWPEFAFEMHQKTKNGWKQLH